MRKIKFRAWVKKNKIMFVIFDSTTHQDWFLPSWKDKHEVMQYTGLKDVVGKEIFEGDIILDNSYGKDVGAEYGSDWIGCMVESIVVERYNKMKPIIITSNLSSKEINNRYSQRIMDRLKATNEELVFMFESLRPKAEQEKLLGAQRQLYVCADAGAAADL